MAEMVVDGDGHVREPPDRWTTRLSPRLRERGLRLLNAQRLYGILDKAVGC